MSRVKWNAVKSSYLLTYSENDLIVDLLEIVINELTNIICAKRSASLQF